MSAHKYLELLLQLYQVDNESTEADALRDKMDPLWYKLSEEEAKIVQLISANLANLEEVLKT